MMTFMVCSFILLTNLSPLKLALTMTVTSMVVSVLAFSLSLSVFPSAGILISFSSGMMVVFCYCAMMANYSQKSSKSVMITVTMAVLLQDVLTNGELIMVWVSMIFSKNLSLAMMVTIMSMISILSMMFTNKSMYKKEKSLKVY
uniref:NADH dehydrogenase subunit 6 n=1 Tax=Tyrophagus longior TaxID=223634 RepID=A0A0S2SXH3_TYRLO|nr:NADH dehydrogenase subunit 6 [Tyrophagus longior]ALP46623.1 NADH dehydrogenase subunit 6 [Tyrophagus longior]